MYFKHSAPGSRIHGIIWNNDVMFGGVFNLLHGKPLTLWMNCRLLFSKRNSRFIDSWLEWVFWNKQQKPLRTLWKPNSQNIKKMADQLFKMCSCSRTNLSNYVIFCDDRVSHFLADPVHFKCLSDDIYVMNLQVWLRLFYLPRYYTEYRINESERMLCPCWFWHLKFERGLALPHV